MGNCIYCGEKAGLFKSVHPECEQKHKEGIIKIKGLPLLYNVDVPFGQTIETSKQIAAECFINDETRTGALVDGIDSLVEKFLDDGVISPEEETTMSAIVSSMEYDFSKIINKVKKGIILRYLTEGEIPNVHLNQCPINLEKDEKMVYAFNDVVFYEMVQEKHYEGGSAGVSIKIAKGVYYRTSAFKGYPVISPALKQKGIGMLFITDRNVYFYSELKSEKIPFKKVITTTSYKDGIGIQKDGKTAKPAIFKMAEHPEDGWFVCNMVSNILEIIKK